MKTFRSLLLSAPLFFYACTAHAPAWAWEWPWEGSGDVLDTRASMVAPVERSPLLEAGKKPYTQASLECMAEAIYFEARGEPIAGQAAIGLVILRRTRSGLYPNDVCSVIKQNEHREYGCQFSYRCDGKSEAIQKDNNPSYNLALSVAECVLEGDCSLIGVEQATLYHACSGPNAVKPDWDFRKLRTMGKIGNHCFSLEV